MPIKLDDTMAKFLAQAIGDGAIPLVGTSSKAGDPQISPKGTVAVFDDDTLCFWERSYRTSYEALAENPKVVIYYRNPARIKEVPYRNAAIRFRGVARVTTDEAARERAWALSPKAEQDRDPQRKGAAILVRIDRVEDLGGDVIMQRD